MADDLFTTADHLADAFDLSGDEVSDLKNAAPLMARLMAEPSSNGTTHKYSKYTQEPVVGFRGENDGRDHDHSVDTIVTETLKILDFSWKVDMAVADAWRQGGAQALIAREGARHLGAGLFQAEKQLVRGTNNAAAGFNGWEDNAAVDALADAMVINAGGTTASTQTSCYLIRTSEVMPVINPDGGFVLGDTVAMEVAGATGTFPAWYTPASVWMAAMIGGAFSMARIVNIHPSDAGAQLDDDNISEALELFPAGRPPDLIVMNMAAQGMLQRSRTATTTTGVPAPIPQDSFGIPILTTDAIVSTEAVVA